MGVFVKPMYKQVNPMAAKNGPGNWMSSLIPAVACEPMRNKGVASPPLKPSPRLKLVAINFWKAKRPDSK